MLQVIRSSSKSFWPVLSAGLLAAAAAYGAVAWVLQIQSISAPASSVPVAQMSQSLPRLGNSVNVSEVAVALGAARPAEAPSLVGQAGNAQPQWTLLGVVAGASGRGSALLAVDGQPPKAYLPGQTVAPGWLLHSVGHRLARLTRSQQEAPTVTLELPKEGS